MARLRSRSSSPPGNTPDHDSARTAFLEGWRPEHVLGADPRIEQTLGSADPKLGRVISQVTTGRGPLRFRQSNARSHFDAIARSIVYQQISKHAAAAVYARYSHALDGAPDAEHVARATAYRLRRAGLSAPKVRYLKALASAVVTEQISLDQLAALPDDAVVNQLTGLPGVGIWTAQMFLMFRLQRPDVLPLHDAGIQRGLQLAHGLSRLPVPRKVEQAGRCWAPHRSLASLYLWAAVDAGYRAR